ncbi:MAG: trimethylamine methyltransferase family protein [Emergencia sp.]
MYYGEKLWSDADAACVHENTLKILENIGVEVQERQAREDLKNAGCRVDEEKQRVYYSRSFIEKTLADSPSQFDMYDSRGDYYLTMGGDEITIGTSGFAAFYLDRHDDTIKSGTYKALEEEIKLLEMLDEANHIQTSIQPTDMPEHVQELYMTKCGLMNTRKPLHLWPMNARSARAEIDMNAAVMGGYEVLKKKPHMMFNICTLSPLKMRDDACEAIREAAKFGVPCFFSSGPMGGATSVATLAGEVSQAWAELLAHNALLQLYNPGSPVVLASWSRIFDMKYVACTVGTPEYGLMRAAITQLCKRVDIPSGGGGFLTDANTIDAQCGWEKFMTGICALQAKQNQTHGLGMLSQLNVFSHEALVIDCEIVRCVKRVLAGATVDEEHLAYNVTEFECCEKDDADFLKSKHTRKHYRTEWMPIDVTDRRTFSIWEKDEEGKSLRQRACRRIDQLLEAHSYSISNTIEDELDRIIAENEKLAEAESREKHSKTKK